MIFFGHAGVTAGAVKAAETVARRKGKAGFRAVDYRLVLLGSLLPDLIDKPLGMFLFRDTFHSSRIFGHSLLFTGLLIGAGAVLKKAGKRGALLLVGVCSLGHLLLDAMWQLPGTLFWPFLSLKFPTRPEGNWVAEDFRNLLYDPVTLAFELAGFLFLLVSFIRAVRRRSLGEFFRHGKL